MTRSLDVVIVSKLCNTIKEYYNVTYKEALDMLYNSKIYKMLEKEEAKMWYYCNDQLFRFFKEERETGTFKVDEVDNG